MAQPPNPNHHLYSNNGVFFIHYTVYPTPFTKERVRSSLQTRCLFEARRRRDRLLARICSEYCVADKTRQAAVTAGATAEES